MKKQLKRPSQAQRSSEVATLLIRLYVSHIRLCAPPGWSQRQINFHIFHPTESEKKLTPGFVVRDGLRDLSNRKSIPRLTPYSDIAAGLIHAEKLPQFTGGLQILYHPLNQLLLLPESISEIHGLLRVCPLALELPFFEVQHPPFERLMKPFGDEIGSFVALLTKYPQERFKYLFPEFKAIALGMYLEARSMCDFSRMNAWSDIVEREELRFEARQIGGLSERLDLDSYLSQALKPSPISCETLAARRLRFASAFMIVDPMGPERLRPIAKHTRELSVFNTAEINEILKKVFYCRGGI